jgi:predicted dehydrogenase
MDLPRKEFFDKELSLSVSRSYGPGRYDPQYEEQGVDYPIGYVRWTETRNLEAIVDLIARQLLPTTDLITHRYAIERATEAYATIASPEGRGAMAIVLEYPPAAPSLPAVAVAPVPSSGKPRLGVIGSGAFAGTVLLPRLVAGGLLQPIAVSSARGLSARHAATKFGFARLADDAAAILEAPDIDSVAIITRHDSHATLAARALAAGKHVFVEKPLALDEAQLAEVLEVARRAGRGLFVGLNRRYSPLSEKLHAFVRHGGPLQMIYTVNAGPLPSSSWIVDPLVGGGRIVGEACHFVDLMSYVCDSRPITVSCDGVTAGSEEHPASAAQNFAATIAFKNGSIGTLIYSALGDPSQPKERLQVFAGGKLATLNDWRTLELVSGGKRTVQRLLKQDKGHGGEIDAFVGAIHSGRLPVALEDLAATSRCTFAMIRAMASGKREHLDET